MDDDARLCVPQDFAEWAKGLPQPVRRKLSIHEMRQVWEGSVREAYRFALPWLDAKGVYHRHDGIDFPSSDACPYCRIQVVVEERDRLREAIRKHARETPDAWGSADEELWQALEES